MRHELPVLVGTHLIYIFQTLAPIHEHITRTGAHEEFYSRDMCTVKRGKRVSVIVGCAIEEAVVHVAVMAGNIHFLSAKPRELWSEVRCWASPYTK